MGTLTFQATLGGSVNLLGPNTAATVNLTLPSADGTSGQALQTNGSGTLSFANLAIANGGTGVTSFAANQIHYGSFSQSANLTFDGTNLGLAGGTANGVAYLNGSKVLTTGSALTFDGTNFSTTGTATAAKLIPTGTSVTGNGLYLPAANSVGISTNGTNAVYIDSTQNVGIGTSSPTVKLDVKNIGTSTSVSMILGASDSASNSVRTSLTQNADGSNTLNVNVGGNGSTSALIFQQSGTEQMRLTGGNLGIGTTSPATRLTVANSSTGIPIFRLSGFNDTDNSNYSVIQFYNEDGSGQGPNIAASIKALTASNGNGSGGQLTFSTSTGTGVSGTEATEQMRIDSSGNVGIGTSSPSTYGKLAVYGTNAGGDVSANIINNSTAASTTTSLTLRDSDGDLVKLMGDNAGSTASLRAVNRNNQLTFWTGSAGGAERMRIDSSGNVGIGATPNASAILDAQSTTKGVRMPNMTTTQKNAISSPAAGLMVFDTTLAKLCVYSGSAWQTITSI